MDNQLFNVNGESDEHLLQALDLIFALTSSTCVGWKETKEKGLILYQYPEEGVNILPIPLTAGDCLPMIAGWLAGDFAQTVTPSSWCEDTDHDGHNNRAWQVYCEDWGHVDGSFAAMCAVKPAFAWCGK